MGVSGKIDDSGGGGGNDESAAKKPDVKSEKPKILPKPIVGAKPAQKKGSGATDKLAVKFKPTKKSSPETAKSDKKKKTEEKKDNNATKESFFSKISRTKSPPSDSEKSKKPEERKSRDETKKDTAGSSKKPGLISSSKSPQRSRNEKDPDESLSDVDCSFCDVTKIAGLKFCGSSKKPIGSPQKKEQLPPQPPPKPRFQPVVPPPAPPVSDLSGSRMSRPRSILADDEETSPTPAEPPAPPRRHKSPPQLPPKPTPRRLKKGPRVIDEYTESSSDFNDYDLSRDVDETEMIRIINSRTAMDIRKEKDKRFDEKLNKLSSRKEESKDKDATLTPGVSPLATLEELDDNLDSATEKDVIGSLDKSCNMEVKILNVPTTELQKFIDDETASKISEIDNTAVISVVDESEQKKGESEIPVYASVNKRSSYIEPDKMTPDVLDDELSDPPPVPKKLDELLDAPPPVSPPRKKSKPAVPPGPKPAPPPRRRIEDGSSTVPKLKTEKDRRNLKTRSRSLEDVGVDDDEEKMQDRPLPAPPAPPRSKSKPAKFDTFPKPSKPPRPSVPPKPVTTLPRPTPPIKPTRKTRLRPDDTHISKPLTTNFAYDVPKSLPVIDTKTSVPHVESDKINDDDLSGDKEEDKEAKQNIISYLEERVHTLLDSNVQSEEESTRTLSRSKTECSPRSTLDRKEGGVITLQDLTGGTLHLKELEVEKLSVVQVEASRLNVSEIEAGRIHIVPSPAGDVSDGEGCDTSQDLSTLAESGYVVSGPASQQLMDVPPTESESDYKSIDSDIEHSIKNIESSFSHIGNIVKNIQSNSQLTSEQILLSDSDEDGPRLDELSIPQSPDFLSSEYHSCDAPDYTSADYATAADQSTLGEDDFSDLDERTSTPVGDEDALTRMYNLQSRLGGYEIIRPGRVIIKEGELQKLSRKEMQPRYFILMSDCLLYTSYASSISTGNLRLNHELPIAGMRVQEPPRGPNNEFSIISVARSFSLAARTSAERDEWIEALNTAIDDNAVKRSTFQHRKLAQMGIEQTQAEGFMLGKQAPVWIPDSRVSMCQMCTAEFTVTFRRHHCRACGKVVCGNCSANRAPLKYLKYQPARVCDECYRPLEEEMKKDVSADSSLVEGSESDTSLNREEILQQFKRLATQDTKKGKKTIPERLKEVQANDEGSQMSGYLQYRVKRNWKRYWFVLKDHVLYMYKASEDVAAVETIPVLGYSLELYEESFDGVDAELIFQLVHDKQTPLVFHADTVELRKVWTAAIQKATVL